MIPKPEEAQNQEPTCKWTQDDVIIDALKSGCTGVWVDLCTDEKFVYCPFCGKKIEVVG